MKIPHKKRDRFFPIIFIISVLLCAVCFYSHSHGTSTYLSKGLSLVVTPLRNGTKGVYDIFCDMGIYFKGLDALKEENEKLVKENKLLADENESMQNLKSENDSLYGFLELKKERTDFKFVNANIVSHSSSGYSSIFTIDKGSFHGIEANMPIISDDGTLLGITYSVESSSTRCKAVTSYDVNVGVYDESTGETGILSGSFDTFSDGKVKINSLSDDTTIKVGDKILTSGLGNIYPRGLCIGTVEKIVPEEGEHKYSAVVKPNVSALGCDRVMIIRSFERVYE